jgi:crossover junction endodeoxyribonuclease RuvC
MNSTSRDSETRGLRVLGIDPGSGVTGFGVVERHGAALRHIAHGNLRLRAAGALPARLRELHNAVAELLARHRPAIVAVEDVFVAQNARAALVLGQARGAALAAIGATGLPVLELPPARVKQALTGNGRAAKRQIQFMVTRMLGLAAAPPADAADALAVAICCAQQGGLAALGAFALRRRRTPRPQRFDPRHLR